MNTVPVAGIYAGLGSRTKRESTFPCLVNSSTSRRLLSFCSVYTGAKPRNGRDKPIEAASVKGLVQALLF